MQKFVLFALFPLENVCIFFSNSGETITSLHYQFRVGRKTISRAIADVCSALYKRLKDDFLKVSTPVMIRVKILKIYENHVIVDV